MDHKEYAKAPAFTQAETDAAWTKEFRTIEASVQKDYDQLWEVCFADVNRWWSVFGWYLNYLRVLVQMTRWFPSSRFLSLWHANYLDSVRRRPGYKQREKHFQQILASREDFAEASATFKSRLASRNIPGRG